MGDSVNPGVPEAIFEGIGGGISGYWQSRERQFSSWRDYSCSGL